MSHSQNMDKWDRINFLKRNISKLDSILAHDIVLGNNDAVVVRLMRYTGIRVGGDESIRGRSIKNSTYGATTLRAKHFRMKKGSILLDFVGKMGIRHQHLIKDPLLVGSIRKLLRNKSRNDPVFPDVTNKTTMEYIRRALNFQAKNHDLRTLLANDIAFREVSKFPLPTNEKEYRKFRNAVGQTVSEKLGNGRYHALNSYIDPSVFNSWALPTIHKFR